MTTKAQKPGEGLMYDTRLLERNLRLGRLDTAEYEAFLKKLPDDEAKGEYMEFKDESVQDPPTPTADQLTFTSG